MIYKKIQFWIKCNNDDDSYEIVKFRDCMIII